MAGITASQVKELRERTGAGMMECKRALVETDGDIEIAIENMRKSGSAKAAKKAARAKATPAKETKKAAKKTTQKTEAKEDTKESKDSADEKKKDREKILINKDKAM